MWAKKKTRRLWATALSLALFGLVYTASAWEMLPPAEPVKKATDDFNQAWRAEASQEFKAFRTNHVNDFTSYGILTFLIVTLGVIFSIMVRSNHVANACIRNGAGTMDIRTRLWLISRWGLRY